MAKASKLGDALDELQAIPPKPAKHWLTEMPAETQTILLGIRQAFQAGQLSNFSGGESLAAVICPKYGIKAKPDTVARWLRQKQ